MNKKTIQELVDEVVSFRNARNWENLTDLKDTAIAVSLESAELLDHFKWKTKDEVSAYVAKHKNEIEEEVVDVLFNLLLLAQQLGTNIDTVFMEKMKENDKKYPVEKVKGKNPHV